MKEYTNLHELRDALHRSIPDPDRFYIWPAKKWVDTREEVLDEWDRWRGVDY